jgi:hypothetical protein
VLGGNRALALSRRHCWALGIGHRGIAYRFAAHQGDLFVTDLASRYPNAGDRRSRLTDLAQLMGTKPEGRYDVRPHACAPILNSTQRSEPHSAVLFARAGSRHCSHKWNVALPSPRASGQAEIER